MSQFLSSPEIQQAFRSGLEMTVTLSAISATLAITIGFLAAFARTSGPRWLRTLTGWYVEVFRNTPLLIQLFFYYRGLQSVGVLLSPEMCGVLALTLYTGAYLTETFRSGLLAVPREQLDAGLSLGLNRFEVYFLILIPQAVRVILPPMGNQLVSLVKNSSLMAFVTVEELFHVIYKGAVDEFRPMEYFVVGGLLYLSLSLGISGVIHLLERLFRKEEGPRWPWFGRKEGLAVASHLSL